LTPANLQDLSLHQLLKAHTSHKHAELDSTAALRRLIRPGLTLAQYAEALQGLLHGHCEVELQLLMLAEQVTPSGTEASLSPGALPNSEALPSSEALSSYRPRVPALRADLNRLASLLDGAKTVFLRQDHSPPKSPNRPGTPSSSSAAEVRAGYLGIRYVLEGATQGGQLIWTRVSAQLPELIAADAIAYWTLLEDARADWSELTKLLARPDNRSEEIDALIAGAEAAYQGFIDSFAALERA
jgi:heme oxygenase